MINSIVADYNRHVQTLAERYSAEGYDVLTQPLKDELPLFLRHFHPDLIAVRPDQSIVVEVKPPGKIRRTDYWRELREAVSSNQGWQLEVVANGTPEQQEESLSQQEIEERLGNSSTLADAGELGASLLLAWSGAEAAMRLIAERYDVRVSELTPASLLSRLYSEGLMDRQDYDFLVARMRQRNSVAHGFRQQITAEDLRQLRGVVHTLLTE